MMTSHPGLMSLPPSVTSSSGIMTSRLFPFDNSTTITLHFLDEPSSGVTRYRYKMEANDEGHRVKVRKVKGDFDEKTPKLEKKFAQDARGQIISRDFSKQEGDFKSSESTITKFPVQGTHLSSGFHDDVERPVFETEFETSRSLTEDVFEELSSPRFSHLLFGSSRESDSTEALSSTSQHPRSNIKETDSDADEKKTKGGSLQSEISDADSFLGNSLTDEVWTMDGVPLDALCRDLLKSPVPSRIEMDELVAKNRNRRSTSYEIKDKSGKEIENSGFGPFRKNAPEVGTRKLPSALSNLKKKIMKVRTTSREKDQSKSPETADAVDRVGDEFAAADPGTVRLLAESPPMTDLMLMEKSKRISEDSSNESRRFSIIDSDENDSKPKEQKTKEKSGGNSSRSNSFQPRSNSQSTAINQKLKVADKAIIKEHLNEILPEETRGESRKEFVAKYSDSNRGRSPLKTENEPMSPLVVELGDNYLEIGDGYDEMFDRNPICLPSCSSPPADEIERCRLRMSSPIQQIKTSNSNQDYYQTRPTLEERVSYERNAADPREVPNVKVDRMARQRREQMGISLREKAKSVCEDSGQKSTEKGGGGMKVARGSRVEPVPRSRSSDRTLASRRNWIQSAKTVEIQLPRRTRSSSRTRKKSLSKEFDVVTVTTTTEEIRTLPKLSPTIGAIRRHDERIKREAEKYSVPEPNNEEGRFVAEQRVEISDGGSTGISPAKNIVREVLLISEERVSKPMEIEHKNENPTLHRIESTETEPERPGFIRNTDRINEPRLEIILQQEQRDQKSPSEKIGKMKRKKSSKLNDKSNGDGSKPEKHDSLSVEHLKKQDSQKDVDEFKVKFVERNTKTLETQSIPGIHFEEMDRNNSAKLHFSVSELQKKDFLRNQTEIYHRPNFTDTISTQMDSEISEICGKMDELDCEMAGLAEKVMTIDPDVKRPDVTMTKVDATVTDDDREILTQQQDDATFQNEDLKPQKFSSSLLVAAMHTRDMPPNRQNSRIIHKEFDIPTVQEPEKVRENWNKISIQATSREYCITAIDESKNDERTHENSSESSHQTVVASELTTSEQPTSTTEHNLYGRFSELDRRNHPIFQDVVQDTGKMEKTAAIEIKSTAQNSTSETAEFDDTEKTEMDMRTCDGSSGESWKTLGGQNKPVENRIRSSFVVSAQHRFDSNTRNNGQQKTLTLLQNQLDSDQTRNSEAVKQTKASVSNLGNDHKVIQHRDDANMSDQKFIIQTPEANTCRIEDGITASSTTHEDELDSPEYEQEITRYVSEAINTACAKTMQIILRRCEDSSVPEYSVGERENRIASSTFFESILIPAAAAGSNKKVSKDIRIPLEQHASGPHVAEKPALVMDRHDDLHLAGSRCGAAGEVAAESDLVPGVGMPLAEPPDGVQGESVHIPKLSRGTSSEGYASFFRRIFRENSGGSTATGDYANIAGSDISNDDVMQCMQYAKTDIAVEEDEHDGVSQEHAEILYTDTMHESIAAVAVCDGIGLDICESDVIVPRSERSVAHLTLTSNPEISERKIVQIPKSADEENSSGHQTDRLALQKTIANVSHQMIVPICRRADKTYTSVLTKTLPVAKPTVYTAGAGTSERNVLEISKNRLTAVSTDSILDQDDLSSDSKDEKPAIETSNYVTMLKQASVSSESEIEMHTCAMDSYTLANIHDISQRSDEDIVEDVEEPFEDSENSDIIHVVQEKDFGGQGSTESLREEDDIRNFPEDSDTLDSELFAIRDDSPNAEDSSSESWCSRWSNNWQGSLEEKSEMIMTTTNYTDFHDNNERFDTSEEELKAEEESKEMKNDEEVYFQTVKIDDDVFESATVLTSWNGEEQPCCKTTTPSENNLQRATEVIVTSGDVTADWIWNSVEVTQLPLDDQTPQILRDDRIVEVKVDGNFTEENETDLQDAEELEFFESRDDVDQPKTGSTEEISSEESKVVSVGDDDDFVSSNSYTELDTELISVNSIDDADENKEFGQDLIRKISENTDGIILEGARKSDAPFENATCFIDSVAADDFYEAFSEQLREERWQNIEMFPKDEADQELSSSWTVERNLPVESSEGGGDKGPEVDDDWGSEETGFSETKWRTIKYGVDSKINSELNSESRYGALKDEADQELSSSWTVERNLPAESSEGGNDEGPEVDDDWGSEETGFSETKWRTIKYGVSSRRNSELDSGSRYGTNDASEADDDDVAERSDYLVTYEYGEMYSVFREIPYSIEKLRDTVLFNFNNSPTVKRLLTRFPSLRPGTWKFATAARDSEPEMHPTDVEPVRMVEHLDAVAFATNFIPDLPMDEFFAL